MGCDGIVVIKQNCTNVLHVTIPAPYTLLVKETAPVRYTVQLKVSEATAGSTIKWLWGNVLVTDPVNIVYDPLFAYNLAPIIFIDGTPVKWARLGIVQNKKQLAGEEGQTPFLDFSAYAIGGGTMAGDIDFQYILP